jgi:hypothetical protein
VSENTDLIPVSAPAEFCKIQKQQQHDRLGNVAFALLYINKFFSELHENAFKPLNT